MNPKAVVIGGGLAGLGAALMLRKLGLEVTVVEKSARPGLLIRGFQRGGLNYETGFHYAGGLAEGGVLHRYLDRLGLFRHGLTTCALPDPGGETLRFAGADLPVPGRYDDLRSLLPASQLIDEFFRLSWELFQRSPYLNPEAGDFNPQAAYNELPSLHCQLAALPLDQKWKNLLGFRCLLYGVRPSEASFGHFSLVNQPYLNGAHTFTGGGEALVRAFEDQLKTLGVTVLCGREVTAIKTDGRNALKSLVVKGPDGPEELAAEISVYSGSPKSLPKLLPEKALRPVLARRLASYHETPPPFLLFAHSSSGRLAGRQLFICPEGGLDDWFGPGQKMVYVSGGPGRNGRWPVSAVCLLPRGLTAAWARPDRGSKRPAAYQEFKQKLAEELRLFLLGRCPELEGDLAIAASATDLSLEDYSFNFGRGIYGKLHSVNEAPILPLTRVGGLALAGQNIILPGLLGVLVSSAVAVGCLLGHKPVLEVLR